MTAGAAGVAAMAAVGAGFFFQNKRTAGDIVNPAGDQRQQQVGIPSHDWGLQNNKPVARPDLPTYTLADLRRHATEEEGYWVSLQGAVYDVTSFVAGHPGGPGRLQVSCPASTAIAVTSAGGHAVATAAFVIQTLGQSKDGCCWGTACLAPFVRRLLCAHW